MTVYAFIPARGGSTRIPRKNLADVGGRSLLERAIDVCREVADRVIVSTDDEEIAEHATRHGASLHGRPAGLASSTAQIEDAIAHWLRRADVQPSDVVILAQPTSPFRRATTMRECVRLVREHGLDSALEVMTDVRREIFSGRIRVRYDDAKGIDIAPRVVWDRPLHWRPRTQDVRSIGVETGSCYAFTVAHFAHTKCRMGGRDGAVRVSWLDAFDIDDPEQLEVARLLAPYADARET